MSLILKQETASSAPIPAAGKGTVFLNSADQLTIKNSAGNVTIIPTVEASGNTEVYYNDGGTISGDPNFTFNPTTGTLTANLVAGALTTSAQPNVTSVGTLTNLLVGATATQADFPNAKVILSQDNSGQTHSENIGVVGEAVADSANTSTWGIGVLGEARANGATRATGVQGGAYVTNSTDTGAAVGVRGYSSMTHSGGYNIGVLGNASGSGYGNYAFYVQSGNIGSIETATTWDLVDNNIAALNFNSTGKANIFGIETTDGAEGIFTQGYLNVAGNITTTRLISNVATGTAPLTVTSTTRVANLNVSYANVADFINITTATSGNGYLLLGNALTGNISETANSVFVANSSNGALYATTFVGALSGAATSATTAGTVTTAAQPNITSVGTLTTLNVSGNITASRLISNIATGTAPLTVTSTTQVANLNVDQLDGYHANITSTANNIVVRDANANLYANNIVGSTLTSNIATGTAPLTVTSTTRVSNLNVAYANVADFINVTTSTSGNAYLLLGNALTGNISETANSVFVANSSNGAIHATTFVGALSGAATSATTAGTVTTNAQPNITSVGTLTSLGVNGTVTAVAFTANTGVFTGNGSGLSAIAGANVTGTVANATYATSAGSAGSATTAGTVTTNAQPNITSVGTLSSLSVTGNVTGGNLVTSGSANISNGMTISSGGASITGTTGIIGNLSITGNINVTGNLNYSNVTDLVVGDPLIYIGANNTGNVYDLGIVASYNDGVYEHTGLARDASDGVWKLFDGVVNEPTTTIDFANGIYAPFLAGAINSTGTVTAVNVTANTGVFTGNGSALTALNASNISTGTLAQARLANSSLTVNGVAISLGGSGTVTATATNALTIGTGLSGTSYNGSTPVTITNTGVTSLIAGNNIAVSAATGGVTVSVTGTVPTATTAGTVTTAAQPNITSVGTLSSLSVTGTVSAGNFSGSGSSLTSITGANVTGTVANATYATSAGSASTAGSATTAGTVTTAAQSNITSVGTLTGLTIAGNGVINMSQGTSPNTATIQFGDNSGWFFRFMTSVAGTPTQRFSFKDTGDFAAVGTVTSPTAVHSTSVQTPLLTTGANTTAGTITGNWTLSSGSKLNATYADLAEKYVADAEYEPGTVLSFGGEHEVTISQVANSTRVAGVVTTDPAYTMNDECQGEFVATIALQGRVPVKVNGPVYKGDLLVAGTNGFAIVNNDARAGTIIGKSLENFNEESGVIEVAVGRF